MKKNRLLLALYVCIVCLLQGWATVASAQPYHFRHFQVENGLSHNAVICSLQDKKGFLWFGTKDGLNRFDGYNFKIFRNEPNKIASIGNNFIHCLLEDNSGTLWIGTENGLYSYNETSESFIPLPNITIGLVRDLQIDKKNCLWFIDNFTLCNYNIATHKLVRFPANRYFEATSVCTDANNQVWVATTGGLLEKYNAISNYFTAYNVFENTLVNASNWIEKIKPALNGQLFIASNRGAKLFTPATSTCENILTYNSDKTEIFARNFLQTSPTECWIATETGIYIYHFNNKQYSNLTKSYNNPYAISDNAVYTFCKDKEGGIWAGTYFGGINYLPNYSITFQKYFPLQGQNSLSGNVVREIHEDKLGHLWIGTEDGGLNRMDKQTGKFTSFKPSGKPSDISYTNIHGLLIHGNELWMGTFEHGLDVLDIKTGKLLRHYAKSNQPNSLKSNFIYSLYETPNCEILVGTTFGVFRYVRRNNSFLPLTGMPLYNWYSCMFKTQQGVMWCGTYGNGIRYYDSAKHLSYNFQYNPNNKNSIASNRINSIFKDSHNKLWFTTEGGLCKFLPTTNNFKRYGTENGFPTNFTLSMLEDAQQQLWISTTKGLVCFNPVTEKAIVYSKENGLLNDQFNFNSAYRDSSGILYFGSVKGFISFNPQTAKTNHFLPKVYFTDFQINNRPLPIGVMGSPLYQSITSIPKITLAHNQSTFSIDFSALSYTSPKMFSYAYKMEGLPTDWTYLASNRKVYFTELTAGKYTFMVRAANLTNSAANQITSLEITILPPWWNSNVAQLLYLLTFFVLLYALVSTYHNRVKEKNERKLEYMALEKDRELYEAKMEFFTNITHEIRTPLTLIKGPLEKIMRKLTDTTPDIKQSLNIMERNTERLVSLTNQILDFRQTEIKGFSVNIAEVNVSELLKETLLSFKLLAQQKKINLQVSRLPKNMVAFIDADAFEKIINNLLSNAIKYAAANVEVQMLPINVDTDAFFTIEIRNDGYIIPYEQREKIFEPFFRLRETEKTKGSGIGLALARSLAELHKGMVDLRPPEKDRNVFFITLPFQQTL